MIGVRWSFRVSGLIALAATLLVIFLGPRGKAPGSRAGGTAVLVKRSRRPDRAAMARDVHL